MLSDEVNSPEVRLARMDEKLESILRSVQCLPALSEIQARHDERIAVLERGGRWAFGIIATILSGLVLAFLTFMKDFYAQIMTGGKP